MKKIHEMANTVLVSILALFCGAAYAEETATPIYALTSSGNNQANTFGQDKWWVDATTGSAAPYAVNNANAAGYEYIITNSYVARTLATSSNVYYGHVTVGTTDSPGTIGNKCYDATIYYQGGLTLVNGQYLPVNAGNSTDNEGKTSAQIGGSIEVLSPNTNPFWFGGDGIGGHQGVVIYADISGAENTGILVGSKAGTWSNNKEIGLKGDNSNFLGSMELGCASYVPITIGSATALGGAPTVLNEEAVKITTKGETKIIFSSSVGESKIPATRGIFLNGIQGGSIYPRAFIFNLEEGANVEVLGPLKAQGTCSENRKELKIEKVGAGTLTLSGAVTLIDATKFTFAVTEGRVVLGSLTALALTNELSDAVWVKSPSAAEYTLSGYTLSEGAGLIVRHEKGAAGTIVLDSTCKIAATPIKIQLATDELGYDAYEVCVLKVPTAVKTLSAADFVDVDVSADYDYPNTTFRVETVDGIQCVYLCRAENNTIAHLTFENGFTSRVRKGTLSAAPTVNQSGSVLSNEVVLPRLTLHGDKETTLGTSTNSLSVNNGILNYTDPGDLLKIESQTIEFYIKSGAQHRWQSILNLYNGRASNPTIWSVLFDSGKDDTGVSKEKQNTGMRFTHNFAESEGAEPKSSGSPISAKVVGDGKWHHIAYTIAPNADKAWATDLKYYIDYELVGSATATGRLLFEPTAGASFGIAVDFRWSQGNKFDGFLDEIRISRGVLEPDQFLQLRRERSGFAVMVR